MDGIARIGDGGLQQRTKAYDGIKRNKFTGMMPPTLVALLADRGVSQAHAALEVAYDERQL